MANSINVFNQIGECRFKEYLNIKELEENREHRIKRFEKVKSKFGPSILWHIEEYKFFYLNNLRIH